MITDIIHECQNNINKIYQSNNSSINSSDIYTYESVIMPEVNKILSELNKLAPSSFPKKIQLEPKIDIYAEALTVHMIYTYDKSINFKYPLHAIVTVLLKHPFLINIVQSNKTSDEWDTLSQELMEDMKLTYGSIESNAQAKRLASLLQKSTLIDSKVSSLHKFHYMSGFTFVLDCVGVTKSVLLNKLTASPSSNNQSQQRNNDRNNDRHNNNRHNDRNNNDRHNDRNNNDRHTSSTHPPPHHNAYDNSHDSSTSSPPQSQPSHSVTFNSSTIFIIVNTAYNLSIQSSIVIYRNIPKLREKLLNINTIDSLNPIYKPSKIYTPSAPYTICDSKFNTISSLPSSFDSAIILLSYNDEQNIQDCHFSLAQYNGSPFIPPSIARSFISYKLLKHIDTKIFENYLKEEFYNKIANEKQSTNDLKRECAQILIYTRDTFNRSTQKNFVQNFMSQISSITTLINPKELPCLRVYLSKISTIEPYDLQTVSNYIISYIQPDVFISSSSL